MFGLMTTRSPRVISRSGSPSRSSACSTAVSTASAVAAPDWTRATISRPSVMGRSLVHGWLEGPSVEDDGARRRGLHTRDLDRQRHQENDRAADLVQVL